MQGIAFTTAVAMAMAFQAGGGADATPYVYGEGSLTGSALADAVTKADAYPLGSKENPVRVASPAEQRAYLARLRCADGRPPAFSRQGSFGAGPFGSILDGYAIRCRRAASATVFMDMYHDHREDRAIDGFTILP